MGSLASSPMLISCCYSPPEMKAVTHMAQIRSIRPRKPRTLWPKRQIHTRRSPWRTRGNAHAARPGRKSKSVHLSVVLAEPRIRTSSTPGARVVSSVERRRDSARQSREGAIKERPGGSEARLTRVRRRDSAQVQLRRSRVQKCKGEYGETARGHVGMVTRGHGANAREDTRAGGKP
jgi:hypothetical protein